MVQMSGYVTSTMAIVKIIILTFTKFIGQIFSVDAMHFLIYSSVFQVWASPASCSSSRTNDSSPSTTWRSESSSAPAWSTLRESKSSYKSGTRWDWSDWHAPHKVAGKKPPFQILGRWRSQSSVFFSIVTTLFLIHRLSFVIHGFSS